MLKNLTRHIESVSEGFFGLGNLVKWACPIGWHPSGDRIPRKATINHRARAVAPNPSDRQARPKMKIPQGIALRDLGFAAVATTDGGRLSIPPD
jgi:hypothetical protein